MTVGSNIISDPAILLLIEQDNSKGWEYVYDKYAAMMYGAIRKVTDDPLLADKILEQSFINFKQDIFFVSAKTSLCLALLRVATATAKELLSEKGVAIKTQHQSNPAFPVLNSILFQSLSLKDSAALHKITEDDCKSMLRIEVNQLRHLNNSGMQSQISPNII